MRDIAQRGVLMVGTAHGNDLDSLIQNRTLSWLVGGVADVTVGDERAQKGPKTKLERAGPPVFGTLLEVLDANR